MADFGSNYCETWHVGGVAETAADKERIHPLMRTPLEIERMSFEHIPTILRSWSSATGVHMQVDDL